MHLNVIVLKVIFCKQRTKIMDIWYSELHIDLGKTLYLILIDGEFQIPKGAVAFWGHTMSKLQICKECSHHVTLALILFMLYHGFTKFY